MSNVWSVMRVLINVVCWYTMIHLDIKNVKMKKIFERVACVSLVLSVVAMFLEV